MKRFVIFVLAWCGFFASNALALTEEELKQIGFAQKVGGEVSRDLMARDSDGAVAKIDNFIANKPTLLVLGYYHCPMLCTFINDGLINAMQQLRLDVGRDFNVVELSIDPRETAALAAKKKQEYLRRYGRTGAALGWHFLTGDEPTIEQVASEVGFRFRYDSQSNEYAHPSGVVVLTPHGKISRYFLGVNIDPQELNAAIQAAAREENGSVADRLVLLCYHYNPITGKYGPIIISILRVSGVATVLGIVGLIAFMAGRDRRLRRNFSRADAPHQS
jgi:protein SCO1/2